MDQDTIAAHRTAAVGRRTAETSIKVELDLDGTGAGRIRTGIGFLDHMLTALARHSMIDLAVEADGDLHVDFHHTTEDVGIVIGQCLLAALGDRRGIRRYGHAAIPMDEALAIAAVDLSGRPYFAWNVRFDRGKIGEMDTELFAEFFRALATEARMALHLSAPAGDNDHHIAEACFKATARALREAVEPDPRAAGAVPSTKGSLTESTRGSRAESTKGSRAETEASPTDGTRRVG